MQPRHFHCVGVGGVQGLREGGAARGCGGGWGVVHRVLFPNATAMRFQSAIRRKYCYLRFMLYGGATPFSTTGTFCLERLQESAVVRASQVARVEESLITGAGREGRLSDRSRMTGEKDGFDLARKRRRVEERRVSG